MQSDNHKRGDLLRSGPWSACESSGFVYDKRGVVVASTVRLEWAAEVAKLPELLAADGCCGVDCGRVELPAILPEKPQIALNVQEGHFLAFWHRWLGTPLACIAIGAGLAVLVCFSGIWLGWW